MEYFNASRGVSSDSSYGGLNSSYGVFDSCGSYSTLLYDDGEDAWRLSTTTPTFFPSTEEQGLPGVATTTARERKEVCRGGQEWITEAENMTSSYTPQIYASSCDDMTLGVVTQPLDAAQHHSLRSSCPTGLDHLRYLVDQDNWTSDTVQRDSEGDRSMTLTSLTADYMAQPMAVSQVIKAFDDVGERWSTLRGYNAYDDKTRRWKDKTEASPTENVANVSDLGMTREFETNNNNINYFSHQPPPRQPYINSNMASLSYMSNPSPPYSLQHCTCPPSNVNDVTVSHYDVLHSTSSFNRGFFSCSPTSALSSSMSSRSSSTSPSINTNVYKRGQPIPSCNIFNSSLLNLNQDRTGDATQYQFQHRNSTEKHEAVKRYEKQQKMQELQLPQQQPAESQHQQPQRSQFLRNTTDKTQLINSTEKIQENRSLSNPYQRQEQKQMTTLRNPSALTQPNKSGIDKSLCDPYNRAATRGSVRLKACVGAAMRSHADRMEIEMKNTTESSDGKQPRFEYTSQQRALLGQIYKVLRYPTCMQKRALARRLGIASNQVKIWFQNRRRKEIIERDRERECAVKGSCEELRENGGRTSRGNEPQSGLDNSTTRIDMDEVSEHDGIKLNTCRTTQNNAWFESGLAHSERDGANIATNNDVVEAILRELRDVEQREISHKLKRKQNNEDNSSVIEESVRRTKRSNRNDESTIMKNIERSDAKNADVTMVSHDVMMRHVIGARGELIELPPDLVASLLRRSTGDERCVSQGAKRVKLGGGENEVSSSSWWLSDATRLLDMSGPPNTVAPSYYFPTRMSD